ncbi:DHA2 family efflux MFS transporter permease subunit [Amycolatopsis sp. CA-128772]|uniref:DHA2 family efflux MFS transporter permease subunit n=1 Tax=Amycolatopsis sp. CA-128772 TaxID=2073159 RepID=UPI000CD12FA3|nr:DHA2 family efflux MFS transporter permease subunit [Amycolatopsis sp. CA-128772]
MATPPPRGRTVVLLTCCLSVVVAGLDTTIANVALPSIRQSLNAPVSGLQWVVDAYVVVLACLLLLAGSVADRFGRRRVFQAGLGVFSLGSLLCGLAPSLGALVGFRALQAVGGAMLNPVAMSIIATTFTDPKERARAVGTWGAVAGLGGACGPVLGGLLVSGLGWRSIFWVNVPIGLLAIVLTRRFVPESRAARGRRFDPLGQLLVVTFLGPVTAAVIEGPRHGWTSPLIVGLFALAAVSVCGLVVTESRRADPLVDVRFFRSPAFSGAAVIAVAALAAVVGFLFLNTLYLQEVRGYSALHAGLLTLPMAAAGAGFAMVSGRIVAARGARLPLVLAGLLLATGTGLLAGTGPGTPAGYLVLAYLLFGAGFGLVGTPMTTAALAGMPRDQAGVAGAIASTCRQTGGAIGVAVCGSLLAAGAATATAWAVLTGCGVAVVLLGLLSTGRRARAHAEYSGRRLHPQGMDVAR